MPKHGSRTARILESVGHELKTNEPGIVSKTRVEDGEKAAEKQRVAILLSKTRKLGARIKKNK